MFKPNTVECFVFYWILYYDWFLVYYKPCMKFSRNRSIQKTWGDAEDIICKVIGYSLSKRKVSRNKTLG